MFKFMRKKQNDGLNKLMLEAVLLSLEDVRKQLELSINSEDVKKNAEAIKILADAYSTLLRGIEK